MGIGRGLQELGRYLDDCEQRNKRVKRVDIAELTGVKSDQLTANLELTLSAGGTNGAVSLCDPRIDDDGTILFALDATTGLTDTAGHDVTVDPIAVIQNADGTVTVTLEATVPATGASGFDTDRASSKEESDVRDTGSLPSVTASSERDTPPFRDPELLAEIYEACETFAEMADALDMDVTGETVRRYMIQHDIHEPTTYQTREDTESQSSDGVRAGEGDANQPVVLSDGIGLPDDVTVDALVETVERSNTLYEVTQDINVDRQAALEMLKDLNLIDLVMGQLATKPERNIGREDVIERLREASAVDHP